MGNVRDGIRSDATCLGGVQHVVSYYHQMERPYGDDSALIMELHSLQSVQNGVHCFILFLGVVGGFINLKPRMIEAKNECGILWQT